MANEPAPSASSYPLWKKVWRFIFWPFYRHFDVLHLEVKELQSGLQTLRMAQEQHQQELRDSRDHAEKQTHRLGTLQAQLEEANAQIAALDPQWRSRFEALQARSEKTVEDFTARTDGLSSRLDSGLQASHHQLRLLKQEVERIQDPVGTGFNYTAFEDRFRGSEATIREWQKIYLPLLQKHAPIVDLGCGRGELLEILREQGITATGVDSNAEQVARCAKKGLKVIEGELMTWLTAQPAASLGAITLLQVIEHLRLDEARHLIAEAARVLRPGGILLMETVNPHCPEALEWFYIDPTHVRPVYPEMLDFLLHEAGYQKIVTRFQSPNRTDKSDEAVEPKAAADFAIWGHRR